jgi:hypothetical protein
MPDGHGSLGERDLVGDRDDGDKRDDRTERDERAERNSDDEQSDRRRRTERGEQWHGDRGELGDGREPRREPGGVQRTVEQVTDRARAATPISGDAFGSTPDMSKALTVWFDMVGDMMKLQQQFFSSVLGAGNTSDRNITKV